MINAQQARLLSDTSEVAIRDYISKEIEPRINEAANAGKRDVFVPVGRIDDYNELIPTDAQQAIMLVLRENGYVFDLKRNGEPYNSGLRNFGFLISW